MSRVSKVIKLFIIGLSIGVTSLSIASNSNNCEFQDNLEGTHLTDNCTLIPVSRAIAKYESKAIGGNIEAQYQLGEIYLNSTQEWDKAYSWLILAARGGHVEAQTEVALLYQFGTGIEENFEKAVFWYKRAADNGDSRAIRNLNDFYEEGLIDAN